MDHVADVNQTRLYQLNTIVELPEFVKEASITTPEDLKDLPSEIFADPTRRQFPMHTRADTWMSREYFDKFAKQEMSAGQAALVEDRLQHACGLWDLGEPAPAMQKQAAEEGHLISYNFQNETLATARVTDGMDMCKAANDLTDNCTNYPWETRRDVARQLLAITELDGGSHEYVGDMLVDLQKMAGYGVGDLETVTETIRMREAAIREKHPHFLPVLAEVKAGIQKAARHNLVGPELLDKTAGLLDAVDRFSDMHRRYDGAYQAPEKSLFGTTMAHADAFAKNATKLPSGQYVKTADLQEFGTRRFIRDLTGEQTSQDDVVEKVAALNPRTSQLVFDFLQEKA
jgi:hypothetical protein